MQKKEKLVKFISKLQYFLQVPLHPCRTPSSAQSSDGTVITRLQKLSIRKKWKKSCYIFFSDTTNSIVLLGSSTSMASGKSRDAPGRPIRTLFSGKANLSWISLPKKDRQENKETTVNTNRLKVRKKFIFRDRKGLRLRKKQVRLLYRKNKSGLLQNSQLL